MLVSEPSLAVTFYLGVEDNGTVSGIPQNAVSDVIKNFIKRVGNPEVISPTVYLAPEMKSAGLYGEDKETGNRGYNLAAVMLFGCYDVIRSIVSAYRTDAIMRKVNLDRYDLLMGFAEKHLWDKFHLENDTRISLRGAIAREMLVNTLIHREFTSSHIARFVIEKDKMFTENANRAVTGGVTTPENFEPNPKNPLIASFFRNIGLADELGSSVRNLYKYSRRYSGKDPELIDGDVFRIIVPLDDNYSFDAETVKGQSKGKNCTINCTLTWAASSGLKPDPWKILTRATEAMREEGGGATTPIDCFWEPL